MILESIVISFHCGNLEGSSTPSEEAVPFSGDNGPYLSKWPPRTSGEGGSAATYNIMAESFRLT